MTPTDRRILALAVPNVLANLSVPLLSAVDLALMGHLDQLRHLGGVALGAMCFDLLYWAFGFLRMGTTGMVARADGQGDAAEAAAILSRALTVAAVGALALLALGKPLEHLALTVLASADTPPGVRDAAAAYFRVRIWAAPATLALYACHGYFLGRQQARTVLALTVLVNLVNLAANLVAVVGLGMEAAGVAWGTLIAQYVGVLTALAILRRRAAWAPLRPGWLDAARVRRFLEVGRDIAIRTLALLGVFAFFRVESAARGEAQLAANMILLQLTTIAAYGIDGFAFAAESLVGHAIGARDGAELRRVIRRCMIWGLAIGVAAALAIVAGGDRVVGLFAPHDAVIATARPYLWWAAAATALGAACFVWDGVFIGATATRPMRDAMLVCSLGVFVPVWWATTTALGDHALWLALTVFMAARGLTLSLLAPGCVYILEPQGAAP